ncbi:MAG: TIGR03769 domain-containing protein, partial [Blastopirellula sp. JB062]
LTPLALSTDGFTTSDDEILVSQGGHSHMNFGFSDPGLYELTIEGFGTHDTDGYKSDSATFTFLVGGYEPAAVPEPASLTLFGLGSICAAAVGLRRRKKQVNA